MGAPVLIGAGVGALGSTLMGGSPFKGALLGGGLGAGYGGVQNLINGGTFMEGAFPFMAETTKPAALSTIAQGGGATMPAFEAPIGAFNTFDMATNAVTNPANLAAVSADYAPAIMSAAGQGGLQAAATSVPLLQKLGYTWDEIKQMMPELNAQNVIGGMNIAQKYMQRPPLPQAQGGGVKQGNPPSGDAIQKLIASSKVEQPRKRISLLVG